MPTQDYKQFDCYIILEIERSATPDAIKAAMRAATKKHHPDAGGSNAAQARINLAYDILSNPITRQAHDYYWKASSQRETKRPNEQKESPNQRTTSDQQRPGTSSARPALSAILEKLERTVQSRKAVIWTALDERTEAKFVEYAARLRSAKRTILYSLVVALVPIPFASQFPILWVLTAIAALIALTNLRGAEIAGTRFPIFNVPESKLRAQAKKAASENCHSEAARLDSYLMNFSSIIEVALRSSSFDDSEIHVARRIAVALFLMGYSPRSYDAESRSILLSANDERLVVRFRHRTGQVVNVTYVQRLHELMQAHGATQGILFCSPGLSGNAASFAQARGIKCYSLAGMNSWIDTVLKANYVGPSGDILKNLDDLNQFLSRIVPKVGYSNRRYRY